MDQDIAVQVAIAESEELKTLLLGFSAGEEPIQSRAFDGGLVVTGLLTLSTASLPVLKAWLIARADQKRSTKVIIGGKQFEAYSREDVIAILKAVEKSEGPRGVAGAE
ncbi:hypothetical protein GCM10027599_23910 [Yimella radicis]